MNETELTRRASEALRLSQEPLLTEALEAMSARCVRELIDLGPTEDDARRAAAFELKLISELRSRIEGMIRSEPRRGPAVA